MYVFTRTCIYTYTHVYIYTHILHITSQLWLALGRGALLRAPLGEAPPRLQPRGGSLHVYIYIYIYIYICMYIYIFIWIHM